ncbi:chaperonin 10-like protein [Lasiosphaeria hispida]|uniref:Chaperonin 10-like protein n=1 Tax=Lasiosphaeria hispida TaxID=260671 RepID=A0AAJ0HCW9_9PEZI|nr:chaperonin 10-like protein [Lasiosphaeria hispida]
MATSQAAYAVEKAIGHGDEFLQQDVSDYKGEGEGESNATMKALVWQGKQTVQVVDVPKPKILEDRDVILKVTGTTVCGSDLHLLHSAVAQMKKGDILGHEFCGVVEQVGPGAKSIEVGKRYVASFQIACGDCFFCKQKLSSQCEKTNSNTTTKAMYGGRTAGIFGYSHLTGGFAGGQAEYVRVPLADVNLLPIPDDVPDEKALFLSDVLPTAYNAVKDTAVYPDDQVAIFGAGPIGQMAGAYALGEGAAKIIFVDTEPRLSFVAGRWPAQHKDKLHLVDFKQLSFGITSKETVVSRLKELCGGRGPDVAIECAAGEYAKGWMHWLEMQLGAETDTSEILNEMVEGVRNYGRAGITGVYVGYANHFNIGSLMQRGIRLIGNGQAPVHKYWEELLQKIRTGALDPTQMLSHRVRMEDLDKVYYKFDAKDDSMQKVFVETKFSFPQAKGTPELTKYE